MTNKMSFKLFCAFALLLVSSEALDGPCTYRNLSIMSGKSFKPLVSPTNCGASNVNVSELAVEPNVVLGFDSPRNEAYSFMLLELIPSVRDLFKIHWLVTNAVPLQKSLTANQSSSKIIPYSKPMLGSTGPTKFWMYVLKQNRTSSGISGVSASDRDLFAPQKWVSQNHQFIEKIVAGVEFTVSSSPNQSTYGPPPTMYNPVPPTYHPMPPTYHPMPPTYNPAPPPYNPSYTPPQAPGHNYPASPSNSFNPTVNIYPEKDKSEKEKKKKNSGSQIVPGILLIGLAFIATVTRV